MHYVHQSAVIIFVEALSGRLVSGDSAGSVRKPARAGAGLEPSPSSACAAAHCASRSGQPNHVDAKAELDGGARSHLLFTPGRHGSDFFEYGVFHGCPDGILYRSTDGWLDVWNDLLLASSSRGIEHGCGGMVTCRPVYRDRAAKP